MILGDCFVDRAYIHLGPEKIEPLEPVHGYSNLWRYSVILPGNPIKDHFKYKYGFLKKGHDFTVPIFGRIGILSKDPSYCEESGEKRVESQTLFDVFHFSHDRLYLTETTPKAVVFYLKWLLPFVYSSSISKTLTQIESLYFISLSRKHVKECINWIVGLASSYSVTDVQRLYLCIVLSHVDIFPSPLPLPNDNKTAEACDRLLQCLNACVYSNFLSKSNLIHLKKIAVTLVVNSSSPGWLTLAAHFYLYLGNQFVLNSRHSRGLNCRYDGKEYKKLVAALLLDIKITNVDDQISHQDLLHMVLKNAPTVDAALELFESSDVKRFFTDEDKKVDFFVKFYQGTAQATNAQKESVGAKLVEFYKIPEKIRGRMCKFLFSTLLEYAKTNDELIGEQSKVFLKSIISEKDLHIDQVLEVLMQLSKSKSVARQNLLLKILGNDLFEDDWHKTPLNQKVDICTSWVITRVINKTRPNSLGDVDTIVGRVYGAINDIMQCSLNIANKSLVQNVSACVVKRILGKEDAVSVLKAFAGIEKYMPFVQECYKSHVKKVLEQTPKAVKKSTGLLKEYSSSRCVFSIFRFYFMCLNRIQPERCIWINAA